MRLKGLKVNFLGDSITEGYNASDWGKTSFWGLLKERDGVIARCYGMAGTRIAHQTVPLADADPSFDEYFIPRVDKMDPDADAVFVLGGTNDYANGDAQLGIDADRTVDTFYGAEHILYQKLQSRYPGKLIVAMTPPKREVEHMTYNLHHRRVVATLPDYIRIIRQVAAEYQIPVIDLYHDSGMNPADPVLKEKYNPDGLHPNDAGHEIIYRMVRDFLISYQDPVQKRA